MHCKAKNMQNMTEVHSYACFISQCKPINLSNNSLLKSQRMQYLIGVRQATLHAWVPITYPLTRQSFRRPCPNSDKASPLDICYRSISLDQQICSPLSFAVTLCVYVCAVWVRSPLNTSCLSFLRNWLSSHCQVCLILSWLTSCYLESHLPEPLNPLVTHNNKKLGRCSMN